MDEPVTLKDCDEGYLGHRWSLIGLSEGYIVWYCNQCGNCHKEEADYIE